MLKCSNCAKNFDALEFLSELPAEDLPRKEPEKPLPWEPNQRPSSFFWGAGSVIALAVLILQLYSLTTDRLTQDPDFRPWLSKLCSPWDCQLKPYQKPGEFAVLQGKFSPQTNENYRLNVVFKNAGAFDQPYPKLKLTLLNFNGGLLAERVFSPQEYLHETSHQELAKVNALQNIHMDIVQPNTPVGGYTIDFI